MHRIKLPNLLSFPHKRRFSPTLGFWLYSFPFCKQTAWLAALLIGALWLQSCGWTRSAYETRQLQQKQISDNKQNWVDKLSTSETSTQNSNDVMKTGEKETLLMEIARLKEENNRLQQNSPKSPSTAPSFVATSKINLNPPVNPRKLQTVFGAKPAYQKAYQAFTQQHYQQAIAAFEDFLVRYPNDIHSDNAQFWIGESHLRLGREDLASQAYHQILQNYEHRPSGEGYKTPEAMYRLGEIALRKQKTLQAKQYLQAIQQRFPQSPTAHKANKLLQQNS